MRPLYAIHGENPLDYDGWLVLTRELGRDPNHRNGENFRRFRQTPIVRLNVGYPPTIPQPQHYEAYAQRVRNYVEMSAGCSRWILGNEMNHSQERDAGHPNLPWDYADLYNLCRAQIKALPGHEQDELLVGAVAPYNDQTKYDGNPSGDWIGYFADIQRHLAGCDGFALHAYARAQTPASVGSADKMGAPFGAYHNGFRVYRDWMDAILPRFRGLPCYITEFNAMGPWADVNTSFVRRAYQEVYAWNKAHSDRPISCLALYRWEYDQWKIKDKPQVIADFMDAVADGLTWPPVTAPLPEPPIVGPEPPDVPDGDEVLAKLDLIEARLDVINANLELALERLRVAGLGLAGQS